MTKRGKAAIWVLTAVLVLVIVWTSGIFGIPAFWIERDARKNSHIDGSWEVAQSTTEHMSVLLYYNEDLNYDICIYQKNKGLRTGYRFAAGGMMIPDQNVGTYYNQEFEECAYFSLNRCEISTVQIDHGQSAESIGVDYNSPFVIILSANTGPVTFYDRDGKIVKEVSGYPSSFTG